MDYTKALAALDAKTKAQPMVVLSHRNIDKSAAVLLVNFPAKNGTPEIAAEAVKTMFNGQVAYVGQTFRQKEDAQYDLAEISVRAVPVSKPHAETASMQAVTASKYMDEANSLWDVTGEGDNRRIVRQAPENLSAILAARQSRLHGVKNEVQECAAQAGDFVLYVSGDKSSLGVVVEETATALVVYNPKASAPVSIRRTAVLEAAPMDVAMRELGGRVPETASGFGAEPYTQPVDGSKESLIKMLSQIFAANEEMVAKLHSLMAA